MVFKCAKNFCRITTYLFQVIGFLGGIALLGLGIYFFQAWRTAGLDEPIPPYMGVMVFFGLYVALANLFGFVGSCRNSRAMLLLFALLTLLGAIAEGCFAIVLFANASLVAGYLKADEGKELGRQLAHPGQSAGAAIAVVVGFQICAVVDIMLFRSMVTGEEAEEEEYWDNVAKEKAKKRKEAETERVKEDFELLARKKVAENDKKEAKKKKKGANKSLIGSS